MNPPTHSTADDVLAETAQPVDALDALLRQIVGGYFVLTDGQGAVSKWSEPAELLFDRPAEEILGHGFFETLIGGALSPGAQAWRGFLDAGEPPRAPGTVSLTGRRSDGDEFPVEAVFVPVKLDEGFDFSLFLEDLSFELPMNLMLLRMRQQHPVVVRALRSAIEPDIQPWEGWRTAGTLVIFRPLSSTPWVEEELKRREADRAAADADTEERLTNPDPGIQGSFADLDDAAAVVARLLSAMERIDELERVAGGLPAQLEESRREAERRAADAAREGDALRSDLQRALAGVPSELDRIEQLARIERLERARSDGETAEADRRRDLAAAEAATTRLSARLDQLERDRAEASAAADARLVEAVAAAEAHATEALAEANRRFEAARAGLEARLADVAGSPDVAAQLERVRAEHEEAAQTARHDLAQTLERLELDRERERETARAELAAALERVEQVQRGADALREQLAALTVGTDDRRRLDELARQSAALAERVEAIGGAELQALRAETAALGTRQDATAAEVSALREAADEVAGLRDAVARQEAATADLAALREAVARHDSATADLAALHEAVARHDSATAELAALHEAVARHEAATAELAALRDAAARHESAAADVASLREEIARHESTAADVASLREEVARHESTAADVAALREEVARHESTAADVAALREAVARHDATASDVSTLREALERVEASRGEFDERVTRHETAADELRRLVTEQERVSSAVAQELEGLRAQVSAHEYAAKHASEHAAVDDEVRTAVGDTQRQIAALHARVQLLGDSARDVAELGDRLQDYVSRDEFAELRDASAHRDDLAGLVGRGELDRLYEQVEELASLHDRLNGLAGRDELAALRETLADRGEVAELRERLDTLAGRDDLAGIAARLDGLAGRDELVGLAPRDELERVLADVDALRDRLAGRDELEHGLAARLDALAGREELRDGLAELRQRLDGLGGSDELRAGLAELRDRLDGFAGRDELHELCQRLDADESRGALAELRERVEGLDQLHAGLAELRERVAAPDGIAAKLEAASVGREELAALGSLVDALPGRDELQSLAGRDELAALAGRVDALAGGEDIAALSARIEGLPQRDELATLRADVAAASELSARLELVRGQAAQAETEALGARQAAAAAGEAAGAARESAARAREESAAARRELEVQAERATILGTDVERLADTATAAREAAATARSDAAEARAAGEGLAERLTTVDQRAISLRAELGSSRERLDAVGTQLDRLGGSVAEAGDAAADARRAVTEHAATLRSELAQVRETAESANRGIEALRVELAGLRDAVRHETRNAARRGDERIEAMQSELTFALASVEEIKQGLTSAGQAAVIARREAEQARKAAQHVGDGSTERVTEVFQQILGMAAARNAASRGTGARVIAKPAEPVKREPRHGFDDAALPLATLTLEGKFKELNPAFAKLVGYQEHQFAKAAWPSPHDRRDYKEQLEQLRLLGLGELHEVGVQSTYMHGQGLMVPVVGTLTCVTGEDGSPSHLLLEAEDLHTT